MEFLIVSAAQQFQSEGAEVMSLALSPLAEAGHTEAEAEDRRFARIRRFVFERSERLYSFKGLHAFKSKFAPRWEPRYLIYGRNRFVAGTLHAVLRAHVKTPSPVPAERLEPTSPAAQGLLPKREEQE